MTLNLTFDIVEKRDQEVENFVLIKYLRIIVDDRQPIFINYEEYQSKLLETRSGKNPPDFSQDVYDDLGHVGEVDIESNVTIKNSGDYILLDYLFLKINSDGYTVNADITDVSIVTDLKEILELRWEYFFDSKVLIVRKCIQDRRTQFNQEEVSNNLAILMSHAHKNTNDNLKLFMDKEVASIYESMRELRVNNQQQFRIETILLVKHTTKRSFCAVDWRSYNLIHLVSHGEPGGSLVFEKDDKVHYKDPDVISKDDFINNLRSGIFKLIFLSVCNSGGDYTGEGNIAYELVREGITGHCIAYRNGVGEISANNFANCFYESLTSYGSIIDAYRKAYFTCRTLNDSVSYLPYLYIS